MDVQDIHVGNQLHVCGGHPDFANPLPNPLRDPVALGVGPAAIPGSIFASGCVLIGNPTSYPTFNEAALMVSRPQPIGRAAASPSIFKVTTKANIPATPLDVMIGDPGVGMVGMTLNTAMINIVDSVSINIVTPTRNSAGNKAHVGASQRAGAEVDTGAEVHTGVNINNAKTVDNTTRTVASTTSCPVFLGKLFSGKAKLD